MKIVVIGAGGVGGYFGARLAEGGEEVTFIARGAHRAEIERSGLTVLSERGNLHLLDVSVTDDIAAVGGADVVLLCTKIWDTPALSKAIAPFLGENALVLSLQNGVDAEPMLDETVGQERVAGAVCYIGAHIAEPGTIRHVGELARLVVGVRASGQEPQLARFAFACHKAGIDLELAPDIAAEIWRKFVFLTALAGATCFYRSNVGGLREDAERRGFFADLVQEAAEVGRAQGVNLPASLEESVVGFLDELPGEVKSSMLLDLERGNRLELDWLTGAVRRLGDELNIETPRSNEVYEALKDHAG